MLRVTIGGMEVRVSLLFPAALVVLLSLDTTGIPLWCVAASAMHEAGHFLAMYALGHRPSQVNVGIFGVSVVNNPGAAVSYAGSVVVALAGPLVNMVSFCVIFAASGPTVPALVHLAMGLFNLIPAESLDGGQALYYALASRLGEETAERIGFAVTLAVIAPLATIGFFLLLRSRYNFTLLVVSLYLALLLLLKRRHSGIEKARTIGYDRRNKSVRQKWRR